MRTRIGGQGLRGSVVGACMVLACVGGVSRAAAQTAWTNAATGDVVSVIGDSITAGRRWHRYIHDYHVTRFPSRRVSFANAGISGDTAGGVLRRLERDVLVARPTVAVFLLGMNDVGRGDYDVGMPATAETLASREQSLEGFRTNMRTLSGRLRANGVRGLIYCSPTPYDETAVTRKTNTLVGVNAGLGRCGAILREVAAEFNGEFVDFHGPMTDLNVQAQRTNAAASIVGWDRIHPGVEGQMVMAYLFLKAQGMPAIVSSVALDAGQPAVLESLNAEVSQLSATATQLVFTALERALPWPVEAEARKALATLPFEKDLNQQLLRVAGLKPGVYRLAIDDAVVGDFAAAELAQGINLAFREETPQYRQAQAVQALLEQRREGEMRLRVLAGNEQFLFRDLGVDLNDFAAVKARLLKLLALPNEAADPDVEPKEAQRRREVRRAYIANKPRSAEFRAEMARLLDQAYAAAQPRPHRYSITLGGRLAFGMDRGNEGGGPRQKVRLLRVSLGVLPVDDLPGALSLSKLVRRS
jgi:lysophospholipase L1-like esterase